MILVGHQPNYLPYLGFFHKIYYCDVFMIVDHVQYVKRGPFGWISRNRIRTQDGEQWLTVPVLVKGKFDQSIKDTRINSTLPWGRKHWRSLQTNYGKSPYFSQFADFFDDTYNRKRWDFLCDLSVHCIHFLMKAFGIQKTVKISSEMDIQGKADDMIIDMCRKSEADSYLHGAHGKDYIEESKFSAAGIRSLYQDFKHPVYRQQFVPFIANLSAVDLLFNHGDASLDILLGKTKIAEGT